MRRWVSSEAYRRAIAALAKARQESGLTQRALAARLGKSPSFVAKIEVGERRLDLLEFIAIARALDVPTAALLAKLEAAAGADLEI